MFKCCLISWEGSSLIHLSLPWAAVSRYISFHPVSTRLSLSLLFIFVFSIFWRPLRKQNLDILTTYRFSKPKISRWSLTPDNYMLCSRKGFWTSLCERCHHSAAAAPIDSFTKQVAQSRSSLAPMFQVPKTPKTLDKLAALHNVKITNVDLFFNCTCSW